MKSVLLLIIIFSRNSDFLKLADSSFTEIDFIKPNFSLPATGIKEVNATLLEELEKALVASDLLGRVHQRVRLFLGECRGTLVVFNNVHDFSDTLLMSSKQWASHSWVKAGDIRRDDLLVKIKVIVHPPNGLQYAGIISIFFFDPGHDILVAVALMFVAHKLHLFYLLPQGGVRTKADAEGFFQFVANIGFRCTS